MLVQDNTSLTPLRTSLQILPSYLSHKFTPKHVQPFRSWKVDGSCAARRFMWQPQPLVVVA